MQWLKKLETPHYWLLAIAVTISAIHFTLLEKAGDQNFISLNLLLWFTLASLLWDKRKELILESNLFSTALGLTLITLILLRTLSPSGYHPSLSPFIYGVGLVLIASGIKRIPFYWKELFVLGILLAYPVIIMFLKAIDLAQITAMFSATLLWISGFSVYRDGVILNLPNAKVEVLSACAGFEIIILMLSCGLLLPFIVPLTKIQKIIAVIVAPTIGFVSNCIRVCLLTFLTSTADQEAFQYWHGEDGSLVFAMISVALFGLFSWFFFIRNMTIPSEPKEV